MSGLSRHAVDIPPKQQAIRDKCFHSTGTFIEFKKEETEQSIPDRFEEQVRRYPGRLAVKTASQELTYDELNKAANRVARQILTRDDRGNEPVALLFTQGIAGITAILGVLKAGRAYVSLDPVLPTARLTYILRDSQAALIIASNQNLAFARELAQNHQALINIDELNSKPAVDNPGLGVAPDSPAYVMYTSGSTGQQKGIVQTHLNVLHAVMNHTNGFHICSDDRLTLLYSPAGISGVKDTLSALLNGASLHPWNINEQGLGGLALWLIGEGVTIYRSAATVFRGFVATLAGGENFSAIRLVYLGNEPVHTRDVDLFKQHFSPDCILADGLGSTETQAFRLHYIDHDTQISGSLVPPGYATEDFEVLLLDEHGNEVGVGQIGEIAVKSRYLSPGYWQRPDLTQAAFLPGPEGGNQRIYLTGDLGRMSPDGCLEHLGRKDFQVKIRGYRVEVGEIEHPLLEMDEITGAYVMQREDQSGNPRLVAYLVSDRHPVPTAFQIRKFLKEKLPDYMVPSAYVLLDSLPTLPNGKVDRQALPAPGTARPELEIPFAPPRTPLEESMVEIWQEVLGLDRVGIHDNFLELGGNSLLAGQVISRVIGIFRVELPLRSLFEAPTVADMAVAIKGTTNSGTERRIPAISRVARNAYRVSMPPPGTLGGHEASD